MNNKMSVFGGCLPALMTPCDARGVLDFEALVHTGRSLMESGMRAVVYCGSMGDWPLLGLEDRQQGVAALVAADIPVVVGTGAVNTAEAVALAEHAQAVGAHGLMVIPRLLSRATSAAAQQGHFSAILAAAPDLPAVIYNSPYYGYETKADVFFALRKQHQNLVGFKEFGGADALSYAAEFITAGDPELALMIGVDTQVVHGFLRCGAVGAITGVGNALPKEILHLCQLCQWAVGGDAQALRFAHELNDALAVLSRFDEGPDLVLYYKRLMVLEGHEAYRHQINVGDALSEAQNAFLTSTWTQFRRWWAQWPGCDYHVAE